MTPSVLGLVQTHAAPSCQPSFLHLCSFVFIDFSISFNYFLSLCHHHLSAHLSLIPFLFCSLSFASVFLSFSLFPFSKPFSPHLPASTAVMGSIGTREGVIQKNLSGLLPLRDFRLDPSLLYSLPLLALSPNLLVVWIFLSVAYFLAKVRCSWSSRMDSYNQCGVKTLHRAGLLGHPCLCAFI